MLGLLTTVATVVPVGVAVEADDLTPRRERARWLRRKHCWRSYCHADGFEQGLGLRDVGGAGGGGLVAVVVAAPVVAAALVRAVVGVV